MVVNTTEPNAIENAEDWANDHFSFTNSHRQQLHDKGTHMELTIGPKHEELYELVFNSTRMEACKAGAASPVGAGNATADAHSCNRRSSDHAHGASTQAVIEMKFTFTGPIIIFSNIDWKNQFEGALYKDGVATAMTPEASEGTWPSKGLTYYAAAAPLLPNTESLAENGTKWAYAIVLLLSAFLFAMMPLLMSVNYATEIAMYICFGNTLAAGVLFTVAIQHIFPEVIALYPPSKTDGYPFAATCVVMGFCAMMVIDNIVSSMCRSHGHGEGEPSVHTTGAGSGNGTVAADGPAATTDGTELPTVAKADSEDDMEKAEAPAATSEVVALAANPQAFGTALSLALGLGIHSLFGGLALGLAKEETTCNNLFIGIIAHKCFAAWALGNTLRPLGNFAAAAVISAIFAMATPIGVVIGINMTKNDTREANGILNAICCGLILFVSLLELLTPAHKAKGKEMIHTACFILGCFIIMLVAINATKVEHNH